ncbi:hypothetical protein AAW14_06165 [Streptomyces hygroscopicus]|nr:hypothetical protein [Streptomyces hygroscopicus]
MVSGGDLTPEQRRVHRVEHILRRDGGSPGSALEGLAAIVEDETWRKVPSGPSRPEPFTSFRRFVEANPPFGLGYSIKQLRALLQLQHPGEGATEIRERMEAMRAEVARLIAEDVIPAQNVGRPEATSNVHATNINRSDSSEYVVARLKRDDPDLAERVVNGEITANAAARQKGWRKPRVVLTSPESIATALRRHLGPDDIAALIRLLLNEP